MELQQSEIVRRDGQTRTDVRIEEIKHVSIIKYDFPNNV